MNLDNKRHFLSWLLILAFALPILIKVEHLLLPVDEHHCHSCHQSKPNDKDVCEILAFDYFFFVISDVVTIPIVSTVYFKSYQLGTVQFATFDSEFGYSLRAPPTYLKLFV